MIDDEDEEDESYPNVTMLDLRGFFAHRLAEEEAYRTGGEHLAPEVLLPQTTSCKEIGYPRTRNEKTVNDEKHGELNQIQHYNRLTKD